MEIKRNAYMIQALMDKMCFWTQPLYHNVVTIMPTTPNWLYFTISKINTKVTKETLSRPGGITSSPLRNRVVKGGSTDEDPWHIDSIKSMDIIQLQIKINIGYKIIL